MTALSGSLDHSHATDTLWRSAVLIGTPATLPGLASHLATLPSPISPIGCLLIDTQPPYPSHVAGLPVLGVADDLPSIHAKHGLSAAIVSIPGGAAGSVLRTRARLRHLGIPERFVPPLDELLARSASRIDPARPTTLDLEELIGRTPYGIDRKAVARVIEGRRVLVTGAGGSIGSEICRIAATFRPSQLILMERSENALFEIDRVLGQRFPDLPRKAVLHDVVDAESTLRHCVQFRPQVIFHAAAHKHVPLMEDHPAHALTNNLFGTKAIADAAHTTGCERFVMISSDKAVNPTSVMGATKRLAEMYVQSLNQAAKPGPGPRTSFTMVRFGNVLGSACSVLPIWSAQLAEGGPITVTDPRMTRYFMTIAEAATLVIQAAAVDAHDTTLGPSPAVLVLDMGEPVRILDLAARFIALHGFEPRWPGAPATFGTRLAGREVDIVFTGARPGEKLHEELSYVAEALLPTPFPGIHVLAAGVGTLPDIPAMIADLSAHRAVQNRATIIEAIHRYVPEMQRPPSVLNTIHRPNKLDSSSTEISSRT
ncbi:MAG: putative polysaccharide biosynthesis protein EpsC [Phycisphaerae bacterium]|nr:MAG: putative polysaccharide biosynthesis protein EpsC [Phycisphaerae bacterium]